MRQEAKTHEPVRRVMTGAAIATAVGIVVCWPWDMFVGVNRPLTDVVMPLLPLTISFTLMGALAGAIFSIRGDDGPI